MHKRKGDLFICTKVERQAFEWIQIAFREEKKNVIHCQLLNLVYPSLNYPETHFGKTLVNSLCIDSLLLCRFGFPAFQGKTMG